MNDKHYIFNLKVKGQELGYYFIKNLHKVIKCMFNKDIQWEIIDKNLNAKKFFNIINKKHKLIDNVKFL